LHQLNVLESVALKDCPSRFHWSFDEKGYVKGYFGNSFHHPPHNHNDDRNKIIPLRGCCQRGNLRVPRQILRQILMDALLERSRLQMKIMQSNNHENNNHKLDHNHDKNNDNDHDDHHDDHIPLMTTTTTKQHSRVRIQWGKKLVSYKILIDGDGNFLNNNNKDDCVTTTPKSSNGQMVKNYLNHSHGGNQDNKGDDDNDHDDDHHNLNEKYDNDWYESSYQQNQKPIQLLFHDGSVAGADLLIGADGIRSSVLAHLPSDNNNNNNINNNDKKEKKNKQQQSQSHAQPQSQFYNITTNTTNTAPPPPTTTTTHHPNNEKQKLLHDLSYLNVSLINGITNEKFYHPLLDEGGFYTLDGGMHRLFTMPFEGSRLDDVLSFGATTTHISSKSNSIDYTSLSHLVPKQTRRRYMWQLSFYDPKDDCCSSTSNMTTTDSTTFPVPSTPPSTSLSSSSSSTTTSNNTNQTSTSTSTTYVSNHEAANLKADALRRTKDWHDPVQSMIQSTPLRTIWGTALMDKDPKHVMNRIRHLGHGRIMALGDAIHPMSPFKGQGCNQALADGPLLAKCLSSSFLSSSSKSSSSAPSSLRTSLNVFGNEVVQRTSLKVRESRLAAERFHHGGKGGSDGDGNTGSMGNNGETNCSNNAHFAGIPPHCDVNDLLRTLRDRNITAQLGKELVPTVWSILKESYNDSSDSNSNSNSNSNSTSSSRQDGKRSTSCTTTGSTPTSTTVSNNTDSVKEDNYCTIAAKQGNNINVNIPKDKELQKAWNTAFRLVRRKDLAGMRKFSMDHPSIIRTALTKDHETCLHLAAKVTSQRELDSTTTPSSSSSSASSTHSRTSSGLNICKWLISEVDIPFDIPNDYGRTPLHEAVASPIVDMEVVHFLATLSTAALGDDRDHHNNSSSSSSSWPGSQCWMEDKDGRTPFDLVSLHHEYHKDGDDVGSRLTKILSEARYRKNSSRK